MQEPSHPMLHVLARIMLHQRASQVGKLFFGVAERITLRKFLQRVIRQRGFKVLQPDHAFEMQLGSGALEGSDADRVIEYIVEITEMSGLGRDFDACLDEAQIVTL